MKSNISKQNNQAESIHPSFLSPAGLLKAEHKKTTIPEYLDDSIRFPRNPGFMDFRFNA